MLTDFQELWPASRKNGFHKNNGLQSINVAKTCEKLRLALTRACNGLKRTQDISHTRSPEELSFRSISRLCYTTLRIHELQVNDLLDKSKELIAQSKDWSTVQTKKRSHPKSYPTAYGAKRKRRANVDHALQDVTFTNYTQLLDETAKFVEWGKTTEIVNKKVSKANSHSRTTCIHIREITINEIDTHNDNYDNYVTEEDDGFGNTTGDEFATFLQMLTDEPQKATKRKAAKVLYVAEKKAKTISAIQEADEITEIEAPRSTDIEYETTNISLPVVNNNSDNSVNEFSPAHAEMSVIRSVVSENSDSSAEIPKSFNFDKPISAPNTTMKLCNYEKENIVSKESLNKPKSNHTNAVIDACIKLTPSEMRSQLQTQINIKARLRKIRAKVRWNSRKNYTVGKRYEKTVPSASELLTTFHHNCMAFRKIKLKDKAKRSGMKTSTASVTYRNLLREILNCEITDDLATQIYKNWNHIEKSDTNNSINYRLSENAQVQQDDNDNERLLFANNTMETEVFDNNNNLQRTNRNCLASSEQDEWEAYDVMIKLLNMWRSQIVLVDEIPVELLFPQTTMSRKAAAKGFGALLRLAANGFILLFTTAHSKHLQCIKLGPASNKLIQKNELNNEKVCRRSSNGFRRNGF